MQTHIRRLICIQIAAHAHPERTFLWRAIRKSSLAFRFKLIEHLSFVCVDKIQKKFNGFTGRIRLNRNGDRDDFYLNILKLEDSKFVKVGSAHALARNSKLTCLFYADR